MRVRILDLRCASDARGLERRPMRIAGVLAIDVNPVVDTAYVRFDGRVISTDRIRSAIEADGFRTAEPVVS